MDSLRGNPGREAPLAALQATSQVQEVVARQNDHNYCTIASAAATQQQHNQGLNNGNPVAPVVAQPGQQVPQGQMLIYQLIHTLRSPTTVEQQHQVLNILKSNPQLMTVFIRHRQQQHRIQQAAAHEQYRYELLGNDWEE